MGGGGKGPGRGEVKESFRKVLRERKRDSVCSTYSRPGDKHKARTSGTAVKEKRRKGKKSLQEGKGKGGRPDTGRTFLQK